MSLDHDKVSFFASQMTLRPGQRQQLFDFLKPYMAAPAAPAAVSAASTPSPRLQRLHAAANDTGSGLAVELKHTTMELRRLNVPFSEQEGASVDRLSAATASWSPQERIRIKAMLHRVGLLDD
jgi:hypothetical protein